MRAHLRRPGVRLHRLSALDRRAFEVVATADLPGLQHVLPRLSRAADHGVLWFGTALALGAARRHRLRRAALRGSLAVMLASPVVNLVGKRAFRRPRPLLHLVPPGRIRRRPPTSHAFPSGHSASAAAFAVGVSLEAPAAVAAPVAVTAAAVAFARIYTGAHYPGDVLAGLVIGAAAALGTRLAWPARPPVAAVRTATAPGPFADDGQGVVVVVNSAAGGSDGVAGLLERELPAAEIVRAGPREDLPGLLERAAARARVLAVAGGDGTVNAGARAALRHDVPLLAVPCGTLDHFCRALGIERPEDAVAAYRAGRMARVDVGTVRQPGREETIFLNTASFGIYTELVDRRDRLAHRLGKWPATALAAVRTLRHGEPVEVVVDGRPRRVWLAFVGNGGYGSHGPAPTWRKRLDDGRLDVRMVYAGAGRLPRLRALGAVLVGHLHLVPGYARWKTASLTLDAPDGLRVARDGETHTASPPVEFRKRPACLTVFHPATDGA